jgi:peptidylprolyl isomerase
MSELLRIDDEVIDADAFIKLLRLTGRYDGLLDEVAKEKIAVHAAKKQGITVTPAEIQERADQLRRVRGLHRAVDMNRYLDNLKLTLDEYEQFIVEMLLYEKMLAQVVTDDNVERYFSLNSPQFDAIDVSHIVVESAGKAKEIFAILEDEPDMFPDLAREHSVSDTRDEGGYIGRVLRGALQTDVEAKVFHAEPGAVLGPFPSPDGSSFEIFTVNAKRPATLDDDTKAVIRRALKDQWMAARAREHRLQVP